MTANVYSTSTDAEGMYTLADLPVGSYTVTASATGYIKDSKSADVLEGGTTAVDFTLTPETTPRNTMHVSSIDMLPFKIAEAGPNTFYTAVAKVTIVDASNIQVEGATVSGTWSGATTNVDSGITDANGQVSLESDKVKNPESGTTFTFTVDGVTKEGWTYDSPSDKPSGSITYDPNS